MLTIGPRTRVFVGTAPVDMRGSFDALAGAVRRLGLDPVDGHLYLFFSRSRRLCRAVYFDGSGWCLFSKRLARGSFERPKAPDGATQVTVDAATFNALVHGMALAAERRPWYRRP
ncbi:MAG: IS66 family insertion sequence element accessory protein TnpB [Vicinamibacterales bacterium]